MKILKDVQATVHKLADAATHAGDDRGAKAMNNAMLEINQERNAARKDGSGAAAKAYEQYSKQVTDSLQTKLKDVLPELAISYVKENAERIDPKNHGKDITVDELKVYQNTDISAVEKVLVQKVVSDYEKYAQTDRNDKTTPLGHMSADE